MCPARGVFGSAVTVSFVARGGFACRSACWVSGCDVSVHSVLSCSRGEVFVPPRAFSLLAYSSVFCSGLAGLLVVTSYCAVAFRSTAPEVIYSGLPHLPACGPFLFCWISGVTFFCPRVFDLPVLTGYGLLFLQGLHGPSYAGRRPRSLPVLTGARPCQARRVRGGVPQLSGFAPFGAG